MKYKVYVDGQAGTTGLKIYERLTGREDIEILRIDEALRHDVATRKQYLNEADIVFLCLPDAAAVEAVSLIENDRVKVIDASTAHRTNDEWIYGIPELSSWHRESIQTAKRVANPGCHATGFNMLVYPLVKAGILSADYPATCHSLTGYSGGGKQMIQDFESGGDAPRLSSPSIYALGLAHKHLPEMQKVCGLVNPPIFTPIVSNYYQGMLVVVQLWRNLLTKDYSSEQLNQFYRDYYQGSRFVQVGPNGTDYDLESGFISPQLCNDTNKLEIFTFGNDTQLGLAARFDNLGKGASGAAVQNMNLMLGLDESTGLV